MEKKIREEILGDKADEIREEIWQKERYAECESINLVKNEKIKEKLIELYTDSKRRNNNQGTSTKSIQGKHQ